MAAKKKYIQVDENYIKQIHSEVCEEWQEKLEAKFPTIFPNKYVLFNKKFTTEGDGNCILIKSPLDNTKVILIYNNGHDCLDCTEHLKNGKITEKDLENNICGKLVKYI